MNINMFVMQYRCLSDEFKDDRAVPSDRRLSTLEELALQYHNTTVVLGT